MPPNWSAPVPMSWSRAMPSSRAARPTPVPFTEPTLPPCVQRRRQGIPSDPEVSMAYVEGYIVPVPAEEIDAYFTAAKSMATIWKELGALSVIEALADDVPYG